MSEALLVSKPKPENAVPCTSWFQDKSDLQLYELLPFLDIIAECADVVDTIAAEKAQCKYTFFGNVAHGYTPTFPLPWQQSARPQQGEQQYLQQIQVSVS